MSELCWVQDENGIHLEHHGIKGQKWGKRRFQNEDGSLTEEGKRRYYDDLTERQKSQYDKLNKSSQKSIERRMEKGKSFTKAYVETINSNKKKALAALAIGVPLLYAGAYAASYYGTLGVYKLASKAIHSDAFARIRQRGAQFMKRYAARKAGAITLGKNSYSVVDADPVKKAFGLIKR